MKGEVAYLKYYYAPGGLLPDPDKYHVELTDINGTETNRLSSETGTRSYPKWSPDGSRLAFGTYQRGSTGHQMSIMTKRELGLSSRLLLILTFWKTDGKGYDTLYIPGSRDSYQYESNEAFWSNDSQRLAFFKRENKYTLSTANWDSSGSVAIVEANNDDVPYHIGAPISDVSWSPNDEIIYFAKTEFLGKNIDNLYK